MKKNIIPLLSLLVLHSLPALAQPNGYQELVEAYDEARALDIDRQEDLQQGAWLARGEAVRKLRQKLDSIDIKGWPVSSRVDRLLVGSTVCQLEFEHAVSHPWRSDPGFYVDRLASIAYETIPKQAEALEKLTRQLAAIPTIVSWAEENLTQGAQTLTTLAIRNLEKSDGVGHGQPYRQVPPEGVIGWYEDLLARAQTAQPRLVPAIEAALGSARQFRDWLKEHQSEMNHPSGVGADKYTWYLKNVRLMPFTIDELRIIGDRELQRALAQLQLEKARNRGLPPLEPASNAEEYERRIKDADHELMAFLRDRDVLTVPDGIGPFDHNVPWIAREGGRRNFWEEIQYRDPLPDDVHAVIPGHRFDAALHSRDKRPIRGTFHDSGRVEGWGFYLEETLMRLGLLENRPRTRELFHIFQAARAIRNQAEIGLQTNTLTLDEAIELMTSEIPYMDRDVARVDCEIYLRNPGYGVSYLMGKVQIERLLAERSLQLKDRFNLKEFHDEFLAAGWIPIALIRWEMTGLTNEIARLTR